MSFNSKGPTTVSRRMRSFGSVIKLVAVSFLLFGARSEAAPFQWQVPNSVRVGQRFPATINATGSGFNSAKLQLTGVKTITSPGIVISELNTLLRNLEFTNVRDDAVDLSGWQVYLYDSLSNSVPRFTFKFPTGSVCPARGVFQLQIRAFAPTPGGYPIFAMSAAPMWQNMSAAVLLVNSNGEATDVMQAGIDSLLQPGAGTVDLWKGELLPLRVLHTRAGAMNHFSAIDWRGDSPSPGSLNANLLLPFLDPEKRVELIPASISLTNGTWTGELIFNDDSFGTNIFFRADDLQGNAGESALVQLSPRLALSIEIPSKIREGSTGLTGKVSVIETFAEAITINLSSSDATEISVPGSVILPAGAREAPFSLSSQSEGMLDGTVAVIIRAESAGFATVAATIAHEDLQTTTLHLEVPTELLEGASANALLRADSAPVQDVAVALVPSPEDRLELPDSVLLKAGSNSVSFPLAAKEDLRRNGDAPIQLRAEVAHWNAAIASVLVRDNELTSLTLQPGSPVEEGASNAGGYLLVLGGSLSSNLTVTLSAEPIGSLNLPGTVVIPAGSNSISVEISVPDNALRDGARTVTLRANAPGFDPASCAVEILDNEIHQLVLAPVPVAIVAGAALPVRISATDDRGRVLSNRNDNVLLAAENATVTVLSNAPPALTNGQWQGIISLSGDASLVSIIMETSGTEFRTHPIILRRDGVRTVPLGDFSSDHSPEMVHVPASGKLFLLTAGGVASVDPQTGALQTYAGAPGGRHLVATDNGQFLYWASAENQAAQVTRFEVASGTWTNYSLAAPVAALQSVPGAPLRFVAATPLFTPPSSWNYGAFMFENGNPLPEGAGFGAWGQSYTALVFDGPNTLLGYEGHVTSYRFARHSVSPNGITFVDVPSATDGLGSYDLQIANGLVYGLTGIFDPIAGRWINRFPYEARPWLHSALQQVLVMEPSSPPQLRSFDLLMERSVGSASLPATVDTRADLAFWGTNGVAVLNRTNLFLIEVPFLSTNAHPDLTVQIDDAIEPAHTNTAHSLKLIVSNTGNAPADDVLVRYTIPPGARLAATPLPTNAFVFANTVTFYLDHLNANSSATLNVGIIPLTGTSMRHLAEVVTASVEINLANNQAAEVTVINSEVSAAEWSLGASDIIWDHERENIYAIVSDAAHPSYGWIVALDLASQSSRRLAYAGTKPGRIALSHGNEFLYVVTASGFTLRRLNLGSLAFDSEFDLLSHIGPIKEIAPVPGRPGSVAVNFATSAPGVIIDDGVQRPGVVLPPGVLRSGDQTDVIIGTTATIPRASMRIFAPPGTEAEATYGNTLPEGDFLVDSGILISSSGLLLDPATLRLIGIVPGMSAASPPETWVTRPNQLAAANLASGLIYYLEQNGLGGSLLPTVHAFKSSDLSEVGKFTVPNLASMPARFIAVDQDTFAFLKSDGQILTCSNPFTNAAAPADISVVQLAFGPSSLGDTVAFQVAVTNHGPNAATKVVLRNSLPADSSFLDVSTTDGSVLVRDGFVEVSWENLPPGEGRSVTIKAKPTTARELKNVAVAFANNPDPAIENNRSYATSSVVLSRLINLQPTDVVYDATANRLLLSVGNSGDRWSNSIVSVDPATGERVLVLRLDLEPTVLAVSDNGKYLYAATAGTNLVLRVDLASRSNDLRIALKSATLTQSPALSVVTVPNQPESIIVSSPEAAVVYDAAIPRPQAVGPSVHVMRGEAPDIFYQTSAVFRRLQLTQDGLSIALETAFPPGAAGSVTPHAGVLAIASGHVMSGVTGELLGQASLRPIVSGQQAIQGPGLFDSTKGTVMFLASPQQAFFLPGALLAGYSTNDFQEQWTAFIPDIPMYPGKFIHAGAGRAAIIAYCSRPGFTCGGSQLVLLDLAALPAQPTADLQLSATSRTNLLIGSEFTAQATLLNAGPWSLTGAVLQVQIPPGLEFLHGSASAGTVVSSNDIVYVTVDKLKSSEGLIADLSFSVRAEGAHLLRLEAAHQGQDIVAENNSTNIVVHAGSLPTVSIADGTMVEGRQSGSPRLILSHAVPEPVQVQLALRNGTATPGADFIFSQLTPSIRAGATSTVIQVNVREDQLIEADETFSIELLSATNAIPGVTLATVTILDNDSYRLSVVSDGGVTEGNTGSTNAVFQVSLSPAAPAPIQVSYLTGSGTAGPDDYEGKRGTLLFAPGVTNLTVNVAVLGDMRFEPDETFALILQDGSGAQLASGSATGLIANDDPENHLAIHAIEMDAQTVTIRFDTVPGEHYILLWREHLASGDWSAIGEPIAAATSETAATHSLTNLPAASRTGFYQVLKQ
jgi:uncharacterized repeat protein (TIGR01451 family)